MRRSLKLGLAILGAALAVVVAARSAALGASMGYHDAAHLLARTGFAAHPDEIAVMARLSRSEAIERILRDVRPSASTIPPAFTSDAAPVPRTFRDADEEARRDLIRTEVARAVDLRGWWVQEMIATPSPLTERMTLFWHNHFVSSQQKVRITRLLYRQNVLLRKHALGNFGDLLHDIAKDPAMVVYLDSVTNRKGQPNENFAREVMELFTLGVGQYTEADVREAARAFTGWSLDPETGDFRFRRALHDEGAKTILGQTGAFDGEQVLDLLLRQPATSRFIVTKLWREFISATPDEAELERISTAFRASNYEIRVVLRELFTSNAFWSDAHRGALIKSPIELLVGSVRQFDIAVPDAMPLAIVSGALGQNLFAPPNVKGWPGGEAWINSSSLLARKQFLERLFADADAARMRVADINRAPGRAGRIGTAGRERFVDGIAALRVDAKRWLERVEAHAGLSVEQAMLPISSAKPAVSQTTAIARLRELALDAAYQLK